MQYKLILIGNLASNERKEKVKIAVPLKYLKSFWRSWAMSLINCEVKLSLSRIENCVLPGGENIDSNGAFSNAGTTTTFKITKSKLYGPGVTLSIEDNVKLAKQLSEGFNRSLYWNKYKVIGNILVNITDTNEEKHIKDTFDSTY